MNEIVLPLALALDLLFGDPTNRCHPVAWMGSLIAWAQKRATRSGPFPEFAYGASLVLTGGALIAGIGVLVTRMIARLPAPAKWLVEAALVKTSFSLRGLDRAAGEVQNALENDDLPEARRLAAWHLVSRDTSTLDESQVAAAVIESVAENASDGVIAPLFYYALGGLPMALVYRFVNTADSLLGYRDPLREWLGKFPARLDDLLNFIPARLTGLLFIIAAKLRGRNSARTWQIMRRDARTTASPNAGYPMSAMAGALGVELEKVGQYRLGAGQRPPALADIQRARKLLMLVSGLGAVVLFFALHFKPTAGIRKP